MNRWMDRIQLRCGGSLGISDDLINFWGRIHENKMAHRGHFEKNVAKKAYGCDIL